MRYFIELPMMATIEHCELYILECIQVTEDFRKRKVFSTPTFLPKLQLKRKYMQRILN